MKTTIISLTLALTSTVAFAEKFSYDVLDQTGTLSVVSMPQVEDEAGKKLFLGYTPEKSGGQINFLPPPAELCELFLGIPAKDIVATGFKIDSSPQATVQLYDEKTQKFSEQSSKQANRMKSLICVEASPRTEIKADAITKKGNQVILTNPKIPFLGKFYRFSESDGYASFKPLCFIFGYGNAVSGKMSYETINEDTIAINVFGRQYTPVDELVFQPVILKPRFKRVVKELVCEDAL